MKSWADINVSKKTMTENLKISFFNQDFQNIQIYICEFIVNKQVDLLLETLIELYCDYYTSLNQKTLTKFNTCIDIVKNKNKNLYLTEDRLLFNDLANDINNLTKTQNLYKKKYETTLLYDPAITINKLNKYNYNIWNEIKLYLPNEHHKYFLELIYLLSSNEKEKFNNLLNSIINKFSKTKLIKNVDTINQNFNDTYVLVFFELFKKYKNLFNEFKFNNYYDLYFNIFNYKLKKSNITNRIPLIFLLFNLLFTDTKRNTYYNNKNKLDQNYISQIYEKLINFYELPKEIKKKERNKPVKNKETCNNIETNINENNKNKNNKNTEDVTSDDVMDYLYTIINYNKKAHKNKLDKVEYNKNNLIRQKIKKPIAIDGDEKIFSSFIKNDVDIVKLNDKFNNYRKNKF
jgi:hypothetical protein